LTGSTLLIGRLKTSETKLMIERTEDVVSPLERFLRSYRKSEVIFQEGSTGTEMYLIHSGKVLLSVRQGKAKEAKLAVLNPGDLFGEMALVDDCCRSATASALEDNTRLIALDKAKFLYIVQQQPQFALSVMHTLCQRLRGLNTKLSSKGDSA
jgi:CRP/FNR family cyclic AMP-dependent transcriptional regulator